MKPVCNATPLIHLSRIGRLDLLRERYTQVLVPDAVADEVARRPTIELDAGFASDWLKRVMPGDRERVDQIARDLGGRGEAEVIGVALELESTVVLIDERAARTYARARGLQVRGALGVVLPAKRRGGIVVPGVLGAVVAVDGAAGPAAVGGVITRSRASMSMRTS